MTGETSWSDRPNRVPWPPIILATAIAAAVLLGILIPIPATAFQSPVLRAAGFVCIAIGAVLDVTAMFQMRRLRANILPHRAATVLVTTGVFAWSRNPIYLGNTIALAGAALALANPWFLAAAMLAALSTQALAIRREEAHLLEMFGGEWRDYAARTPRWLGMKV